MSSQLPQNEFSSSDFRLVAANLTRILQRLRNAEDQKAKVRDARKEELGALIEAIKDEKQLAGYRRELKSLEAAAKNHASQRAHLSWYSLHIQGMVADTQHFRPTTNTPAQRLREIASKVSQLSATEKCDVAQFEQALTDIKAGIRAWQGHFIQEETRRIVPSFLKAGEGNDRVYLLGNHDRELPSLHARHRETVAYDRKKKRYFTLSRHLGAPELQDYLPNMYRSFEHRKTYNFTEHSFAMGGINLHEIFDEAAWSKISAFFASQFGGCEICGETGGAILACLGDKSGRKQSSVDAHEFLRTLEVEGPARIGVMELTGIVILCATHHACFHRMQFARRSSEFMHEQEAIYRVLTQIARLANFQYKEEFFAIEEATKKKYMEFNDTSSEVAIDLSFIGRIPGLGDTYFKMRKDSPVKFENIIGVNIELNGVRQKAISRDEWAAQRGLVIRDSSELILPEKKFSL